MDASFDARATVPAAGAPLVVADLRGGYCATRSELVVRTAAGGDVAAVCELTLHDEPDAAARARALAGQCLPDVAPDLLADAQLVLTELVSNAQLHAAPPVTVRVARHGDRVRVEVADTSQQLVVMPVPSQDAMTGRGLSLVAALSTAWGVEPASGGGKVVWAELAPGSDELADAPDIDLDAFLAAWEDDDADEPLHTVRLGAVPTDLLIDAKRHIDNVVRELTFDRAAAVHGDRLPAEHEALIETVTGSFAAARSAIKEQAAAAAARGDRQTELVLTLGVSAVAAGERYLSALDEADRYAREARLLTLETPPLHRLFRRWYVQSLVEQLRARGAGEEPVPSTPFLEVLSHEVASLTSRSSEGADPTEVLGPPSLRVGGRDDAQLLSLTDAARAIAGARSVEHLLEVVTEAARQVVGAHQAVAARLYGGSWAHAATYVSLSDAYSQYRTYDVVPQGLGVLNVVTRENRPLRLDQEQLRAHPEFRGLRDAPGHPPLPDYLAAPFISRAGENMGLLQLSDKVDGTPFSEADEAVCVQLGLMVSSALEHLEVAQELESALERLRNEQEIINALHDVGRAVISELEQADVVQVVTDAATAMTGAQFGAFFYNVLDASGASYALYTIAGVSREAFSRFPMPRSTDIFAPTFNGDGVVRLDDVTRDPRYGRQAPHHGMPDGHLPVRSYLAVPVKLSDGEVAGGLFFGHEDAGVFDENSERLAVGIAGYASIALENGRLYDAARRETQAKQEAAAALERSLQPPVLPRIPGAELGCAFQPFSGVGGLAGDFYDVFALDERRWLLVLGDVAGKGPAAAAVAGLVRSTLWAAAQLSNDIAAVLRVVNAALLREDSERFATLVVAVVVPADSGLLVDAAWAGHPAGVLLGPDGVTRVAGDGLPVGMFDDVPVERIRFTIAPGETLLLFTDGLLEREDAVLTDEDLNDVVRRFAGLPAVEIPAAVAADVDRRHARRDDVAILAVGCPPD